MLCIKNSPLSHILYYREHTQLFILTQVDMNCPAARDAHLSTECVNPLLKIVPNPQKTQFTSVREIFAQNDSAQLFLNIRKIRKRLENWI